MFKVFSVFFRYFLIFLIVFVWVRFYVNKLPLAILYTTLIAIIIEVCLNYILSKMLKKRDLKSKEKEKREKMFYSLIIKKEEDVMSFFSKLFEEKYEIKKHKNFLKMTDEKGEIIFVPCFKLDPLMRQNIVDFMKKIDKNKKVIFSCYVSEKGCREFVKQYGENEIIILEKDETYEKIFEKYNIFPEISEKVEIKQKKDFKKLLEIAFSRDKTKGYFFSSIVVLFSTLIVRFNVYYAIMSTVLLVFALISFVIPMYRKKTPDEIV